MSLDDFELHLRDASPAFRCYRCGDRAEKPIFLAPVGHQVNPPADKAALATIDNLLSSTGSTIRPFYPKHDGLLMYAESCKSRWSGATMQTVGVAFFRVCEWEAKSDEMRECLRAMGFPEEEKPTWMRQGIAFGEIPHSTNYFVIQPTGEDAGKVFYADQDAFQSVPIANSFDDFLAWIVQDPAEFLNSLGCYTRYSDGKTQIQWIPKEYVAG